MNHRKYQYYFHRFDLSINERKEQIKALSERLHPDKHVRVPEA